MTWEGKVTLRASSAPPDATPVWVDITAFVHPGRRGTGWAMTLGRQSTLAVAEPARLTLTLDNADHRFTPDNPSSPYFPWWTQGCRLQLQEQIGSWASDYPDFFLELPEVIVRTPGVDQTVTLTAVDRLGRLRSARTFVSTLAEYILYNGGTALQHYWPMNETVGPSLRSLVGTNALLVEGLRTFVAYISAPGPSGEPTVVYGAADPVDGDDIAGIVYNPAFVAGVGAVRTSDHTATIPAISVPSGQSLTLAAWVNWTRTTTDGPLVMQLGGAGVDYLQLTLASSDNNYYLSARDDTSAQTDLATSIIANIDAWRLVAIRITEPAGLVEFWHHGDAPVTYNLTGAPSAMTGLTTARIATSAPVQMTGFQIYAGAGAYTRAQHLAQVAQGYLGLDRQRTGERVRTIAAYAGVSAGEIDADDGVAVMFPARLAGKDPLTALLEAETTEQGRLYCTGSRLSFRHRHMRYDDRHED